MRRRFDIMRYGIKFMLLVMFFCFSSTIMAQDIIVKKDGSTIKAKVEKVTDMVVEYKKFTNLTGPTYTVKIEELLSINYENGEKDVFGKPETVKETADDKVEKTEFAETVFHTGEKKMSDADLLNLSRAIDKKVLSKEELYKKGKRMKIAGYTIAPALVAGGLLTMIMGIVSGDGYDYYYGYDYGSGGITTAIGCGVGIPLMTVGAAVGIPLIVKGNKIMRQSKTIQSTSLYQYEIPFGKSSSFTADINMMSNSMTHEYTPALGFHLNF